MDKGQKDNRENCKKYRQAQNYTHWQEIIDNLPYIIMTLLGAVIFLFGLKLTLWGLWAAIFYVLYSIAGAFWIIIFICPYCHFYDTRACPCGYGQIAAKILPAKGGNRFKEKFKKHIPVIFPLWFVPLIAGIIFLVKEYNNYMFLLYVFFIINSFIILPLLARIYGCGHCQQKEECPWMRENMSLQRAHFLKHE